MKKTFITIICSLIVVLFSSSLKAQTKLLYNHIGYESTAVKPAVILCQENDKVTSFSVINNKTGLVVAEGEPSYTGTIDQWRDWHFWTFNFDKVSEVGTYTIRCVVNGENIESYPFLIQENLLERNTLSDVVYYFKGQRSSGLLDKADRNMTFLKGRTDTVDVHGGWYDATGDYGKHLSHLTYSTYFNPQQINLTVWSLFETYKALDKKDNPSYRQYKRKLLDEALYGADFLHRMKSDKGSFYRTISGKGAEKKAEDRRITPTMTGYSLTKTPEEGIDGPDDETAGISTYEVSYRAGAGLSIAALAIASTYEVSGDFESTDYLKTAETAFTFLESHNASLTNDGKENIVDDYCALMAATELYKATKKQVYLKAANQRASSLSSRLMQNTAGHYYLRADDKDRPFFHAADAGLPVVSLVNYSGIADEKSQKQIKEDVRKLLTSEMQLSEEVNNPFGYARQYVQNKKGERRNSFFFPHDTETAPWWQGENARLGSIATASRMASKLYDDDPEFQQELKAHAWNQLNWILGLNPFDACMLEGQGRNNVQYLFFNSYEYTNAPGGICNGITAGLYNENDIDLNRGYNETGKDNDWRWAEQWLPHAAWYLIAIASQ
ncbi:glycoside hydrolase family 9 protein [Lutimonas sp.]|uniref:glycoside hydrolase family 9 protein n=1 Tax=Lutimonas sp. TaxID=1872403 RepID=UPI003D9BE7FD